MLEHAMQNFQSFCDKIREQLLIDPEVHWPLGKTSETKRSSETKLSSEMKLSHSGWTL
jgi:hypothetical protein